MIVDGLGGARLVVLIILIIIFWVMYYIHHAYQQTLDLKESFDQNSDQILKNYDEQISNYESAIQNLKLQLHNLKEEKNLQKNLVDNLATKHQISKVNKKIIKDIKKKEDLKTEKGQYMVLLAEYHENKMQDPKAQQRLRNWIKRH